MSYTPNILIKKSELDAALKKEFKKYFDKKTGWFEEYTEIEHKLKSVLAINDINVPGDLNYLDRLVSLDGRVYKIEKVNYYWFWTEFTSQTDNLLKFLNKNKISYVVEH